MHCQCRPVQRSWLCEARASKPHAYTKQLSGKMSNQLFTAKGKYHLFFTL